MELQLTNKAEHSSLDSITIVIEEDKNVVRFVDGGETSQELSTKDFLDQLKVFEFEHPLFEEKLASVDNDEASIVYHDKEGLFALPAQVLATFVYKAPSLKAIKVSPAKDYPFNNREESIRYSPNPNVSFDQSLSIESFEQLVQDISKRGDFHYYNDFIFDQSISLSDLNETIDGDAIYSGERDIFLKSLSQSEPIAIRYISAEVGHGAFATRDLEVGEIIGLYTGELLLKPRKSVFSMWLGNMVFPLRVDANHYGNLTRFINHAEKEPTIKPSSMSYWFNVRDEILLPNCAYRGHSLFGFNFVTVEVTKAIKKNQQILVYYGKNYWGKRAKCYLTKRNKVISEASPSNENVQAPSLKHYQFMIDHGVKRVGRKILFRPVLGLILTVICLSALRFLL